MKCKMIIIGMLACSLLTSCGTKDMYDSGNILETAKCEEDDDVYKIEIKDASDLKRIFSDPFVEGNLCYEVKECNIYTALSDANIEKNMLIEPHNIYFSQNTGEKYQDIDDFVNTDGSVADTHELVLLELEIKNDNAVGLSKKNEFSVSNIAIRAGENTNQYNAAYFSEAGKIDENQPFHYELKQGETLEVTIGYFVLKDDLENMIGAVSNSDIQFLIKE